MELLALAEASVAAACADRISGSAAQEAGQMRAALRQPGSLTASPCHQTDSAVQYDSMRQGRAQAAGSPVGGPGRARRRGPLCQC